MNVIKRLQEFKTNGIGVVFTAVVAVWIATNLEPSAVAAQQANETQPQQPFRPMALKAEPFQHAKTFEAAAKPLEAETPLWYVDRKQNVACIVADENPIQLCLRSERNDILLTTFDVPSRDMYSQSRIEMKFVNRDTGKVTTKKYVVTVAADFQNGVGMVDQMDTTEIADLLIKSDRLTAKVPLANGTVSTVHFVVPRSEDVVYP